MAGEKLLTPGTAKNFEKRVDETGILLYTKQVVSDESSKRQPNLTNSRIV